MRTKAIVYGVNDLIWTFIFSFFTVLAMILLNDDLVSFICLVIVFILFSTALSSILAMTKCFFTGGNYLIEQSKFGIFTIFENKSLIGVIFTLLYILLYIPVFFILSPLFIVIYLINFFKKSDEEYESDDNYDSEFDNYEQDMNAKKTSEIKVATTKQVKKRNVIKENNTTDIKNKIKNEYQEPVKEKVVLEPGVVKNGNYRLIWWKSGEMSQDAFPEKGYGFKTENDAYNEGQKRYRGQSKKWWIVKDGWPNETVYESWK